MVRNFLTLDSVHGTFIVNRHCSFQADALVKTGRTHIEAELATILFLIATLPDGCVVIDAGANIGLVSVPVAQALRARGGVVHAFEVQRMIFCALCGAVALNDLENLVAHHAGLGAAWAAVTVPRLDYGRAQDFGTLSLCEPGDEPASEGERVAIRAIDELGLARLDFLKVDVEGMELEVLAGAANMIAAHHPWCWVEHWKLGAERIADALGREDYRFFLMDPLNVLCAPRRRLVEISVTINAPEI